MDEDDEVIVGYGDECSKSQVRMELRELQLHAYASLVDAVRASGKLDEVKKNFLVEVRKYFDISDARHQMECKRASLDPHLSRIAECLTGIDYKNSWRLEGTPIFPEPPLFRRMCTDFEEVCDNKVTISLPVCVDEDSDDDEDVKRSTRSASDAKKKSSKKIKDSKSHVPRTNNKNVTASSPLPPVPANEKDVNLNPAQNKEGKVELSLPPPPPAAGADDDKSGIAISLSEDAMEVTVKADDDEKNKNSPKNSSHVNKTPAAADVKSEVLVNLDEEKMCVKEEKADQVVLKQEPNNTCQDLKVCSFNDSGIPPFLLSLLQQPRNNNCPPLDNRMSLLNFMTRLENQNQTVHYEAANGKEFGVAERHWLQMENRREQGVQTIPVSFAEEDEDYSSSEDEDNFFGYGYGYGYPRAIRKERSPDITDTPTSSPIKQRLASLKSSANTKKAKGAKRKLTAAAAKRPTKVEISSGSKKKITLKNTKQIKVKNSKQLPKIKIINSKSKGASSAEGDDDVQKIEVKSSEKSAAVTAPAPAAAGRGRGLSKVRGGGAGGGRGQGGVAGRGRGSGRGRPPSNSNTPQPPAPGEEISVMNANTPPLTSPLDSSTTTTTTSTTTTATVNVELPSPSKSLAHFPSPSKPNNVGSTKPPKATKPKKSKPVSCSRRKSSLKAKEDDEMQVTWDDHDYEGAVLVRGNNLIPIRKRRSVSSNDASVNSGDEHIRRKERIYFNNDSPPDDQQQYWNKGIIKRRISTNTGDEDDPESQPFNDDETDSASENESERGDYHTVTTPPAHNNNQQSTTIPQRAKNKSPSPSPPVQHPSLAHKQRLTTPLKVNSSAPIGSCGNQNQIQAQLPRITLPPPVFSTTLNDTRAPKPVSVVDSLNLHLPITPTASSLAASSVIRRTPTIGIGGVSSCTSSSSSSTSSSTGSGCGIFSNSQALIANSRGTPGILQKQRKAQPHILSNSKAHQRTFIPTSNNNPSQSQSADSYAGETDFLILTLPNNL